MVNLTRRNFRFFSNEFCKIACVSSVLLSSKGKKIVGTILSRRNGLLSAIQFKNSSVKVEVSLMLKSIPFGILKPSNSAKQTNAGKIPVKASLTAAPNNSLRPSFVLSLAGLKVLIVLSEP